ncbi:MAG: PKD domain-containing protein, partial [Dinghuibacter sp.]|nr:PKD domain-containing protein [Dinghuibacter sp.]
MATFTKNRDSSCGPGSAIFTNTSGTGGCNGDIYKWNVRFEDPLGCSSNITPEYEFINGTRDTSANPEIRFNKPGRFIITLTTSAKDATASGCPPATSQPDTFIVKGPPKIPPLNPGTICPNDSINLNITPTTCYSPGPLSCSWTFTNGTPAASNNCIPGPVIYNTLGNHPITLTVTDASCNLSTTVTDTVRVINAPTANAGPDTTFCSGDTVRIGPAPQTGVTYLWTPATGLSNPNIANPLISLTYNGPNNADTISYTLEVSGGPGCKGRDTVIIIVKRKPLVTINPGAATLCRDSSVTLTATGANSYSWVPGGAVTPSITVTPLVTTNYIVTGTLAATGCSAKDTAVITVTNKARAEFTLSDSVYCVDVHLNTAVSVNHYPALNQLYTWYINGVPNNPNTMGAPPDSVITTPGAFFNIKLVTTSVAGCAPDSLQSTFRTKPSVTAAFSKSGSSGCGPYLVTFTNLTSPPSSFAVYYWDFGNLTTSTQFQPGSQTFLSSPSLNDTTYYITLKVYDGCDTTQYLDSVKVFPKPSARFSVSPTTGCSPFAVQFINNSLGNNTAYYWNFDNGHRDTSFSNTDIVRDTFITAVIDTFNVQLIAENGCGRDTQYLAIVVSPSTIQPIIVVGGTSLFGCSPHTAVFTNNSVGAATLTWNFGDGSSPEITLNSQSTITHLYALPGVYNVSIRLRNSCTDTTVFRQVTVYPKPQSSFTLNRNLVCPGDSVSVTSTAINANAVEWLWGDGTTSAGNTSTHIYTIPGTYNIRLVAKRINNFGLVCTDTSAAQPVTVLANIPAIINITSLPKFCAPYTLNVEAQGAAGATIARWTFFDPNAPGGQVVINALTASYPFNQPGQYAVKLFVQNAAGCNDSVTRNITVYPVPTANFDTTPLSTCLADTIARFSATYSYAWPDPISLRWFVNGQPVGVGSVLNYQFRLPPGAA